MFIKLASILLIIIPILVNVAFLTLLERKILGYSQTRKGPNKVRAAGILQPIADAVKLFLKEYSSPHKRNKLIYVLSPIARIFLML